MAVVSRVARIRLFNSSAPANFREWTMTASAQDVAAGGSLTITLTETVGGALPPQPPNGFLAAVTIDGAPNVTAGTPVRTLSGGSPSFPTTWTFHLTSDGLATGSPRIGTLQLYFNMYRTGGLSTETYDVSTDSQYQSHPAGFTSERDQGWIRGTTTGTPTVALSNAGGGNPKVEPADFGEVLTGRIVLPVTPYNDPDFTFTWPLRRPDGFSMATAQGFGSASATQDVTVYSGINDVFDRADVVYTTAPVIRNAGLTGQAWTTFGGALPTDTIRVDPRIHFRTIMQKNTSAVPSAAQGATAFDTPNRSMLASDLSYLLKQARTARSRPITTALAWTEGLRDAGNQLADRTQPVSTGNQSASPRPGGEAGWGFPAVGVPWMIWSESKPGGAWKYDVRSISTSGATAAGMIVDAGSALTMLAQNPALRVVTSAGPTVKSGHSVPGLPFQVGLTVLDVLEARRAVVDVVNGVPQAFVAVFRLQDTGPNQGLGEFLDLDYVWKALPTTGTVPIYFWPMPETRPGSGIYATAFSGAQTLTWGEYDIFTIGRAVVAGTPYQGGDKEIVVGTVNNHDRHRVNPIHVVL